MISNQKFSFVVPIKEVVNDVKEFDHTSGGSSGGKDKKKDEEVKIEGVAIKATVSRNGRMYEATELEKSIQTMQGVPMGVDHSDSVSDIVGLVESAQMVGGDGVFVGNIINTIKHPDIVQNIRNGLVKNVSVEALVDTVEESMIDKKKVFKMKGITFTGLDFVKTPGVEGATFGIAESINKEVEKLENELKEEMKERIQKLEEALAKTSVTEADEDAITDEPTGKEPTDEPATETPSEEPAADAAEEKPEEKVAVQTEDYKQVLEKLSVLEKTILDQKKKGRGIVETKNEETQDDVIVEKIKDGMVAYARNPWGNAFNSLGVKVTVVK